MTGNFSGGDATSNAGDMAVNAFNAGLEACLKNLGADACDDDVVEDVDDVDAQQGTLHNVGTIGLARVLSSNPAATVQSIAESLKDITVSVAFGRHERDIQFETRTGSFYNLVEECLTTFERGKKDGPCFVFGALSGGQRIAKNVVYKYGLGLDFDTGVTVQAVIAALARHGWLAIIHTTHSHLKTVTDVKEVGFENYARKVRGFKGHFADIPRGWAIDYLRDVKKYEAWVLEGAEVGEFTIKDGGRAIPVTHKPMPKVRAIIPFKERFDFGNRSGTQKEAIEESKDGYDALAAEFGHASDPKCNDAARLFFTPRIPRDAVIGDGQHEIIILDGDLLDFEHYCTLGRERAEAEKQRRGDNHFKRTASGDEACHQFETAGLLEFLKHADDFRAGEAVAELAPDSVITHVNNHSGIGVDAECPTVDLHTEQKLGDRRFAARDPDTDSGKSWTMFCLGATCSAASGNDRAWYLDKFCVKHGLTVADLLPYSDKARAHWEKTHKAREAEDAAKKLGEDDDALKAAIAGLDKDDVAAVEAVLAALSTRQACYATTVLVKQMAEKLDVSVSEVNRLMKTHKAAHDEARKNAKASTSTGKQNAGNGAQRPPSLPVIDLDDPPPTAASRMVKCLDDLNAKDLRFFARDEGGTVRLERAGSRRVAKEMNAKSWRAELTEQLVFKKRLADELVLVWPDTKLTDYLLGTTRLPWPVLDQVVTVPVFSPEGHLQTRAGYDPDTRCYLDLDPDFKFRDTPKVGEIIHRQVQEAIWWLEEATHDLPFSDVFDGSEAQPVYVRNEAGYARGEDGHLIPNWGRGRSSRANLYALILQQFVRSMIKGPCPAYVFDKPIHGTGATYLADVPGMIFLGRRMPGQTMGHDSREVRQSMGSTLRTGAPYMFLDNINMHVDNGDLAAGLTVGELVTRILGKTEMVTIQVRAAVMFAGNNLTFSQELMRRLIPIRLDRGMENPAKDWNEFKYQFHDFLEKHRADLIWAVHVLVLNWIQKGRPAKSGGTTMGSFEEWERVLGGILESAGVEGFLVNRDAYLAAKGEEAASDKELVAALYVRHRSDEFTAREVYNMVSMTFGDFGYLNLDATNETRAVTQLGRYLARHVEGRSYKIEVRGGIQGSVSANGVAKPNPTGNPTGGGKETLEVRFTCPHTVSPKRWKIVPSGT